MIHRYKGSGSDIDAILIVQAFLDLVINAKRIYYRSSFFHRGFYTRCMRRHLCFTISASFSVYLCYRFFSIRYVIIQVLKFPI